MQQFHNPRIADYEDFLKVEQVIEDIALDAQDALDYDNGDQKNLEEEWKMDMLNDRYEEQLERDSNQFGGCEW